jgi:hypothetical protein
MTKITVKPKKVKPKKEKEVLPISLPSDVKKIDDKYVVVFDD